MTLINMELKHTNLEIENEYPKLVRDRIPEIIKEREGVGIKSRMLEDDAEFLKYLLKKLSRKRLSCRTRLMVVI